MGPEKNYFKNILDEIENKILNIILLLLIFELRFWWYFHCVK